MSTTFARVRNVKIGETMTDVAEHKHDGFGWHWASAGHRDDGQIHQEANALEPNWGEGVTPTPEQAELYEKSVRREIINQIPSKAKPKESEEGEESSEESEGETEGEEPAPRNGGRRGRAAATA